MKCIKCGVQKLLNEKKSKKSVLGFLVCTLGLTSVDPWTLIPLVKRDSKMVRDAYTVGKKEKKNSIVANHEYTTT